MSTSDKPDFVLETYIKTTPEKLWEALTDGEISNKYFQGNASVQSDFKKGSSYKYLTTGGDDMLLGEILEVIPMKRLSMTFRPAFMEEGSVNSHNVYEIEEAGESCKLTIMHFGVSPELASVGSGWGKIAARLKTYLETGETLDVG